MKEKVKKIIKENYKFILTVIIIIILFNIKLPYYVLAPGGVINITDRVNNYKVEKGSLNMLYVSEYELTPALYLYAKVLKWDIYNNKTRKISNEDINDIKKRNIILRDNSLDIAKLVAYKKAGKEIKVTDSKNIVIATTKDNNLKVGDIITHVDNIKCDNITEIKRIINDHNEGDNITFNVIRDNDEIQINTKVYKEKNDLVVGVVIVTDYEYILNPNIDIKFRNSESGSSGGLMLTLTIYNAISGNDIINGKNIAGTGTIDANGRVGEIDGIKYKIIGAYKNHMDTILVPSANYEEAIMVNNKYEYNMNIIRVDTIDDAIEYLTKK